MIRILQWWRDRRHNDALERAAQAEAEADKSLSEAMGRWAKTREDSRWIRSAREANHLTELFNARLHGGNHP